MKNFFKYFLSILILANVVLLVTGNTHWYPALYYNFADIDDYKIFENRIVKATNPKQLSNSTDYNTKQYNSEFEAQMKVWKTKSLMVLKHDSVVYEKYWDGYNAQTLSGSFSVAKSIVSILIGVAIKEGKIKNIDEPVSNYIKEFAEGDKNKITIRNLLTMSSGLKWDEAYSNPWSITTKAYYGDDLYTLCSNLKVETESGKIFNYQSCNSQLLSFVVKSATGKSVSQYASEKLWGSLGAEHDALWSLDKKDGLEKAYCCFNTDARDFARLGLLYLHKGNYNGSQIVDTNYVTECTQPNNLKEIDGRVCDRYGMHWWCINRNGTNVFYARGILGQYIFVIPQYELVIVRLGDGRGEPTPDGHVADVPLYIDETIKLFANSN